MCLANTRQINVAFAAYAVESKGATPIGYNWVKTSSFQAWSNDDGGFINLGRLYKGGHLTDETFAYCPSETDREFRYEGFSPWNPVPSQWGVSARRKRMSSRIAASSPRSARKLPSISVLRIDAA